MLLCVLPCGTDPLCAVPCLQENAELSPWLNQSLSCLLVLTDPDTMDAAHLSTCVKTVITGDGGDDITESQARIVNSLASLASRKVSSCGKLHNQFLRDINKFSKCANQCSLLTQLTKESAESGELPQAVLCAHSCFIKVAAAA